jgi:hypothetical protein
MGASAGSVQTDLRAPARQSRIEQAYQRWLSARRG